MTKSHNLRCNMRQCLLSGIFFLLFLNFLFPICSFCRFRLFNIVVYQLLTNNQQVFKKKIMIKQPSVQL